jgi:predicted CoA-substrate-specific enzyme activase
MEKFIGLDAGSVSVKLAVLDSEGNILKTQYVRHKGRPLHVAYELLRDVMREAFPFSLSVTGSGGKLIAHAFGIEAVNEVVAQSYSTRRLYPSVRTIIEMGGEDSKLILLEDGKVKEFSMNSVCAAGTGSFLDQQAERLRLSIEEFSEIALQSKNPPRIAGRCSVFAKSDMIHLQQIATPMKEIVAGLCFAVVRNFKGSICKNIVLPTPISFQGGVAANKGVIRAIKEIFKLEDLVIPEYFALMPAIGAALKNIEQGVKNPYDIDKLKDIILSQKSEERGHEPLLNDNNELRVTSCQKSEDEKMRRWEDKNFLTSQPLNFISSQKIRAYLGIDVGSISTNLAVIDENGQLLSKRYLMTAGRPIEAVKQGLDEIGREVGDKVEILGVGTTGSGRYMTADFVGADIVKNEITAQARAAVEIDPQVDTIFEIGGQDSKYITLKDGIVIDFEMNKACAAGTGSFLEEQAEKLDILIKEEFSDMAFKSQCPSCLGERCTVFMENSLLSRQQRGVSKEDLVAGLSYSIVQNYINRVVGDKPIGERIFFQGGVAFNKAVVAAFEKYLNKKIIVPPHHDVTGAIGMALIAKEHRHSSLVTRHSSFKGFDLSKRDYEIKSFECKGCDNLCEINKVQIDGEKDPLFYGSRCEKYDVKRKKRYISTKSFPDLFAERRELLTKAHNKYRDRYSLSVNGQRTTDDGQRAFRIGIPMIFYFHDFLPFWSTLLWELGFNVEISSETNRHIINKGIENILAESCFPHKVAHGHIKELIDRNVDAIIIPSFINFHTRSETIRSFACPYVQTMPYITNVAFTFFSNGIKIIKPVVNLELGKDSFLKEIYKALQPFSISMSSVKKAFIKAQDTQREFISAIKSRGREILENIDEKAIVIIGRSYNAFDPGVNMEIPKKLSDMGVFPIPMDYLPLEDVNITELWPNMYWRSGQNILRAAKIIRDNPNLFALYISNFSCGPDSFIHGFFKKTMADKPFLQIEIDEHSANAGIITRCEAFLDSIKGSFKFQVPSSKLINLSTPPFKKGGEGGFLSSTPFMPHASRVIYIPRMSDHAFGLAAAFETCGLNAEVMDAPDIDTVKIGRRYVSGKECYPCIITTGDMVKKTLSSDFDPSRAVFFMPSGTGPCRFGQYNILHRLVLNKIGLSDVPVFSPNQDSSFYRELGIVGKDFTRQAWKGIIAIELLIKCLHEARPYEINKGETEGIYNEYLLKITRMIKSHNGAIDELLNGIRRAFERVPKYNGRKPLIGVIGEIFVRHNAFSNEDIIKKVEALGGEVWLAPVEEWLYYVNSMAFRKALTRWQNNLFSKNSIQDILSVLLTRFIQKKIEHKYSKPFKGFLKTLKEPTTREILSNASPYLHSSFEGEAILSMGKAVDFVKNGASGIINAMPFGCMPGTIVSALLKGLKQDRGIPCLNIAYDGTEATCSDIQLEAFMHQAYEYSKRK